MRLLKYLLFDFENSDGISIKILDWDILGYSILNFEWIGRRISGPPQGHY